MLTGAAAARSLPPVPFLPRAAAARSVSLDQILMEGRQRGALGARAARSPLSVPRLPWAAAVRSINLNQILTGGGQRGPRGHLGGEGGEVSHGYVPPAPGYMVQRRCAFSLLSPCPTVGRPAPDLFCTLDRCGHSSSSQQVGGYMRGRAKRRPKSELIGIRLGCV